MAKNEKKEHWKPEPDDNDFAAAANYLSLLFPAPVAAALADALRRAETTHREAKDLVRASRLPLLTDKDPHVARYLKRVERGEPLAPIMLIRGNALTGVPLTVADGYHRICASHHLDVAAPIPCRIADLPAPGAPAQRAEPGVV